MEIGRLLALSESPMDIVLNTLAATFIVELDEVLFEGILTNEQKAEYFALSQRRQPVVDVHTCSESVLGWMRFTGLLWQYFYIRHTGFAHDGYQASVNDVLMTATAYLLIWFAEVFVRVYRAAAPGQRLHGFVFACLCGSLGVVVGYVYWTLLSSVGQTHWEYGQATEAEQGEIWACMSEAAKEDADS